MLKCLLLILSIMLPFLSYADNLCQDLFLVVQRQTLNRGLVKGLFDISEKDRGDLSPMEVSAIQHLVDIFGHSVFIVGSAAKGKRRAVGSDLPLAVFGGGKKGTKSDIDYVVKTGRGDLASRFPFPDMDSSWGVREVDYINLSNGPTIIFSPFLKPLKIQGEGLLYIDSF